ncbi:MAG: hypothetical protein VKL59_07305 [Nostocaceae cyanobacterium]|nr:hypothetical protein [Nostocaceae cyanobacterium]
MLVSTRKSSPRPNLWFERLMAILATLNLGLVLFDISYVPWRDFYYRNFPKLTQVYDPVKGIEPHRDTDKYLQTVNKLQEQVDLTGIKSPQVEALLQELQNQSVEMIDSNPFAAANKSGTLEKIKNRMRDHINQESAKQSFRIFWSQQNLEANKWQKEIAFFDKEIRPLIAINYFRRIGENSELIDNFWLIDIPFIAIFALELLGHSYYIKRRYAGFNWLDAALWRWYDVLLLIPFWRWLRVIPVAVRLDQAKLISLHHLRQQIHRGVVASFAEELTEIVVVRVINQIQDSIQRGELINWLFQKDSQRPYIDINNINEVEALAGLLVKTTVYNVLPKIQPELIAILRHNIDTAFNQSPGYRNLENLPGVGHLQKQLKNQLSEQIATQVTTGVYSALVSAVEDPVAAKLSSKLMERFSDALAEELKQKHTVSTIQNLLSDFLEEVKLNYVQRLSQEDLEKVLEQTRQLRSAQSTVSKRSRFTD